MFCSIRGGKSCANAYNAKVAIVGTGFVGSTIAYTLVLNGVATHIALIDANKSRAEGEALELGHCMQFAHTVDVVAGDDMALVKDAAIVVLCAGSAQKPGQSRTDLLETNVRIFKDIVPQIAAHNSDCVLLVVTNPLDVLTYITLKLSKFPPCSVFGTGTVLDSARLRYHLATYYGVSPKDVSAYILGEHGDSEFVWWSGANIAGVPLEKCGRNLAGEKQKIYEKTKNSAAEVIAKKGATYYAIALVVTKIIRAFLLNQSRVFSVSTLIDGEYGVNDICLSIPTIVRGGGVCERLPLDLNNEEQLLFKKSAEKIKENIEHALKIINA